MSAFKFTKRSVENVELPQSGQVLYRDTMLPGFGLRVGQRSKVFVVEGQVNRRTKRVTIGRTDVMSVDDARKRAMATLSEMAAGKDPAAEKRKAAMEAITLDQAFNAFFTARTALAAHTVDLYSRTQKLYLKDWQKTAMVKISRQMVLKRHQRIAKENGEVTANNVMRHLRSVYNFTAAGFEEFPANPVTILTQGRAWYPEKRRRGVVSAQNLPDWWAAVMEEPDYSRDFLFVALFTGMRRAEVGGLRWENINLPARTLHIPTTKNGDPLDLPLSDFLVDLLRARRAWVAASPWVFPSVSKAGHIVETKKFTARVTERCGLDFTMHDLRRTFITIAESLDIPHYALKRLLNHRISGDVTGGYIVIDSERLRGPVEKVAAAILRSVQSSEPKTALLAAE